MALGDMLMESNAKVNNVVAYRKNFSALESTQRKVVRTEILSDGKVRCYEKEKSAGFSGLTRCSATVTK